MFWIWCSGLSELSFYAFLVEWLDIWSRDWEAPRALGCCCCCWVKMRMSIPLTSVHSTATWFGNGFEDSKFTAIVMEKRVADIVELSVRLFNAGKLDISVLRSVDGRCCQITRCRANETRKREKLTKNRAPEKDVSKLRWGLINSWRNSEFKVPGILSIRKDVGSWILISVQ